MCCVCVCVYITQKNVQNIINHVNGSEDFSVFKHIFHSHGLFRLFSFLRRFFFVESGKKLLERKIMYEKRSSKRCVWCLCCYAGSRRETELQPDYTDVLCVERPNSNGCPALTLYCTGQMIRQLRSSGKARSLHPRCVVRQEKNHRKKIGSAPKYIWKARGTQNVTFLIN